jgi:MGT family glycosyltransferase
MHPARSAASPDLVLLATSPALEYPRADLPRQFWFTGPLIWQSRLSRMPARVAALRTRHPIVYVSQGATYNRNPAILKLAFRALGCEPVQMVATVVRAFDAAEFDPLPNNVILERFVPFSELVDRLSVVITHGGAGAVQAALGRGVPVIVLPLAADQFEVAARCAWTGAGIRLDPRTCTASQLREAVQKILWDPFYRINARRIMDSFASLNGPALAATLLERLAQTRKAVLRASYCDPWALANSPLHSRLPSVGTNCPEQRDEFDETEIRRDRAVPGTRV